MPDDASLTPADGDEEQAPTSAPPAASPPDLPPASTPPGASHGSAASTTSTARRGTPPTLVAAAAAILICGLAAHRATEREALRLGGTPVSAAPSDGLAHAPDGSEPGLEDGATPPGPPRRPALPPEAAASLSPSTSAVPAFPGGAASAPPPGDLEAGAVAAFSAARPELRLCLRQAKVTRPDLAGQLPVEVRVGADGKVTGVALGNSPLRDPAFDACAGKALVALTFPPELTERSLSITFNLR